MFFTRITIYRWPKKMMVHAPQQQNSSRDIAEISETERIILEFFLDEANVAELIGFLSLEENKESDKSE